MDGKKSKETKAWEDQLLHPHKKAGRIPRAAGVALEDEGTVPNAAPSHGRTDRGKSNAHAFSHAAHGNTGIDPVNKDRRGLAPKK